MADIDLTGASVCEVRGMTDAEMEAEGWYEGTTVIVLSNGIKIYASRDEEGNGPGELFGADKAGDTFFISHQ